MRHIWFQCKLFFQVATNLVTLQTCLTKMMGKPITMDQLRQDVGNMVEKITKVIAIFRQFQLKMEEYVCLKVIAMVSQDGKKIVQNKKGWVWNIKVFFNISFNKSFCLILDLDDPSLSVIHDKYLTCLRTFTKKHFPNQPNRVEELLVRLPEVSSLSWNEYIWFRDLNSPWNVLFQNHLFLLFFHRSRKLPLFCWSPKCFTCHSY